MILASYNLAIKRHKADFFDSVDMIRLNSPWYQEEELVDIFRDVKKPKFVDVNIKKRSKAKLTDHDYKSLLRLIGNHHIEWVAISNVESPDIYDDVRLLLGNKITKICAKIETSSGCWSAEDIINKFDGIMVDVEDLASEVGWEKASTEKQRIYNLCEQYKRDYFRLGGVIFEYIQPDTRTTVYSYGVWDIIHPGHLNILRKAKEQGDRLIVGVVGDDAVKELKGSDRPIQPQSDRLAIISALSFVDEAIPQTTYDPTENLEKIHPNILVKGDDWDTIPGQDWITEHGGKLIKPAYSPEWSTSSTIKKIRGD